MHRIESIDYLRGLMAVAVAVYHYWSWTLSGVGDESYLLSGSVLSKLGIYAVSIFYIISGLSLFIAYHGKLNSLKDVVDFSIKRVFRIAPLFWLVVSLGLLLMLISAMVAGVDFIFPTRTALLNYTLTFGFLDPFAYFTTGAWSIGNEVVFYILFAFVFLLSSKWPSAVPIAVLLSIIVGSWFAYAGFDKSQGLDRQWSTYVNPLNQAILFFLGVFIGKYRALIVGKKVNRPMWLVVLISATTIFIFYPVEGDKINLVTGNTRMVFIAVSVTLVAAVYFLDPRLNKIVSSPLKFLGESSYSIYLMHPIVAVPVVFIGNRLGMEVWQSYCVAFCATLFCGWLTYRFLELPMIAQGKRFTANLKKQSDLSRQ